MSLWTACPIKPPPSRPCRTGWKPPLACTLLGLALAMALAMALATGCTQGGGPQASSRPASNPPERHGGGGSKLRVFASHAMLAEAAQAIGGDQLELLLLVPLHVDPATWKPTADDLQQLQRVDLIVLNGAGYEPWVASVALPSNRMVRTANSFRERWIETAAIVHSHGPGGEHSHAAIASTTWLDLELAQQQVSAIAARLKQLRPQQAAEIDSRCRDYLADLAELDRQMQQLAERLAPRPVVVSHPIYQYWERRYRINLRSVQFEPTEPPGAEGWAELDRTLTDFPAKLFIWEATPSQPSVEALAARGISSVVFSPAGNPENNPAWRGAMRSNLENLRRAIEEIR